MAETKNIHIKELEVNKGQIEGLPQNPRFIKDERFTALKKSIEDAPEMLALRELIVYPHNGKFVIIAGNMRFRACKELGYKEIPCKVLPEDTPVEKLREYTIKDNIGFGADDWDLIANEWDIDELDGWGMELPDFELNAGEENGTAEEESDTEEERQRDPNSEIIISCVSLFGKTEDMMFVEEISMENTERIISLSKSKGINNLLTELLNRYEGV